MVIKHYSEKTFAIDVVSEAYHLNDPVDIVNKVKEILAIDVTTSEVIDYLSMQEEFEQASNTVKMKDFFQEGILYE